MNILSKCCQAEIKKSGCCISYCSKCSSVLTNPNKVRVPTIIDKKSNNGPMSNINDD